MKCSWPLSCPNDSITGSDYCSQHTRALGIKMEKVKKVYSIPKVSVKEKARKAELKKMYHVFLSQPENEFCKIKLKGCLGKATVVHHVRSRIGDQIFEVNDWLSSCVWCNIQLENDPEAYKKGLKKSKFHE